MMQSAGCPRCGAPVIPGAPACQRCGASLSAVAPPSSAARIPPIRVCAGCGVIAPLQRSSCAICNTTFGPTPAIASGAEGGAVWARIHESDFVCRGCGLRSPTTVGFGEEIECLRCGLRQAFPPGQWEKGLAAVHAVADLCGPDPEGRFPDPRAPVAAKNPHRSVGLEHTSLEHTESSTIIDGSGVKQLSLRVKASPGHPLCMRCHVPLATQLDGRGNAQTTCSHCGDRAVYALPAGAAEKAPALRAVIGDEHRTDRPAARVASVDASGVAAINCPSCGASLSVARGEELSTCQFCRTTARIARRAWVRAGGEAPPFEPFWVLLEGPSRKRAALAHGRSDDEHEDRDDDDEPIPATVAAGARPRSWDAQTIRMIIGLVTLAAVGLAFGGYKLYEYVSDNYEVGGKGPAKPPPKPKPRR